MELETTLKKFQTKKVLNQNIYVEEKNIVFGTIVSKSKKNKQVIGINVTIGYVLPNNTVYDFISKDIFELYNSENLEQEGHVFLLSCKLYKDSNRKINIKSYSTKIQPIIDDYMKTYYKHQENENNCFSELKNPECIPMKKL